MLGFGYNVFGQISGPKETKSDDLDHVELTLDGSEVIDVPVVIDIDSSDVIVKIISSWTSTFFLKQNGTISTFGLIQGTKFSEKINNFIPDVSVQDISCTCSKVIFLTREGKILLWKDFMHNKSSPVVFTLNKSISMIRCGDLQTIALTDDGHIGHLVTDASTFEDDKCIPTAFFVDIPFSHFVKSVSCGKEHVVILTSKGAVFTFGEGSRGQLGNGSLDSQAEPKPVEALVDMVMTVISSGGWHSSVISSTGDLYMWGWNKDGQVGVSGTSQVSVQVQAFPIPIVFDDDSVVDVSCGARHTAAVTSRGEVWTWGFGCYGQLGHGNRKSYHKPTKIKWPPTLPTLTAKGISLYCSHWNTFISIKRS